MDFTPKTVHVSTLGPAGMDFDILADDTIIGPSIANGAWEDHETTLFNAHLKPGARVLDLGANVGWFAVQAILAGCEVHAFEPVPGIAALTERNMARAMEIGPGKGVLHRAAAGDAPGTATIVLGDGNHGDNRVVDGDAPDDMANNESIEIAIERVDDHVSGSIDFLKVDTQGSEWLALQGAQQLLANSPSLGLLIEFWPYALRGCEPGQLLDLLLGMDFTLGKATEAPYPMTKERLLSQALGRDPVKGGLDLYGARGRSFHVLGLKRRLHGMWRSIKEA
ncbi:MAG: FkbM family methyltransferase [Planctomycetota bacterium]|nr:FkbM family methyltransferase [Planctomycetota bacterium]